jgi:hypothetical protein
VIANESVKGKTEDLRNVGTQLNAASGAAQTVADEEFAGLATAG